MVGRVLSHEQGESRSWTVLVQMVFCSYPRPCLPGQQYHQLPHAWYAGMPQHGLDHLVALCSLCTPELVSTIMSKPSCACMTSSAVVDRSVHQCAFGAFLASDLAFVD